MPRDVDRVVRRAQVRATHRWLRSRGIPTETRDLLPHKVTARDLACKLQMPLGGAAQMLGWLASERLVDADGTVLVDPSSRRSRFEQRLFAYLQIADDALRRDQVSVVFRLAYALHEDSHEYVADAVEFMFRHGAAGGQERHGRA